jgi:hypothetical protein
MPPSTPTLTPEETILAMLRDGPLSRTALVLEDGRVDYERLDALGVLLRAGTIRAVEEPETCKRCNGEGSYGHGAERMRCFGCRDSSGLTFRPLIAHA